jgi:FkbM family methyltransferase
MIKTLNYKDISADVIVDDAKDVMSKYWLSGSFYEAHNNGNYKTILPYIYENYSSGVMVDVGAHKGNHSLFFSQIFDRVISFEPEENNFKCLRANLKLNDIKNVITFNMALSDKQRKIKLTQEHKNNSGSFKIFGSGKTEAYKMDDIVSSDVDYIKIDVEGHQEKVILGAERIIEENRPVIFVEGFCPILESKHNYKLIDKVFNASPTYIYKP